LEAKLASWSPHRTSHGKWIFLTNLLLTSFAHFEAKLASWSAHRTSHGEWIFLSNLLFTSVA
jgi:hypothetical protein